MILSRRTLLAGIAAAPVAAPAIVKAAIEPGASYALGIGADIQCNGVMESAYLGSLANAIRDYRALVELVTPSDVLAQASAEYERLERLGICRGPMTAIALDPLANISDDALDSMYERD